MPVYRVMRESFRNDQGDYVAGVVWVYDGKQIRLAAAPGFDAQRQALDERLTASLQKGWHTDEIWASFAQQGGQHWASMRSMPEPLLAPNVQTALDGALVSLTDPSLAR